MTDRLAMFVRNVSDLETNIVAVERIDEYSNTQSEAPWDIPETKPSADWPREGHVTIAKYSNRYRPGLDLVLKQISCGIKAGEKVRPRSFAGLPRNLRDKIP